MTEDVVIRPEIVDRDYTGLIPEVLRRLFPEPDLRASVDGILESYDQQESDRVRLGILKAADGDIERIRELTELARTDFRDLLVLAEYPLSVRIIGLREEQPETYDQLLAEEQAQYDCWLEKVLKGEPDDAG